MSTDTPTENSAGPLPEYEVNQYFPKNRTYTDEEKRILRQEYGRVRAYFKMNPDKYARFQRTLNQARIGETYDIYLTKSVRMAAVGAAGGVLVGLLLSLLLVQLGVLSGLESPVTVGGQLVGPALLVTAYKEIIAAFFMTLLLGAVVGAAIYGARVSQPQFVVSSRQRQIDFLLPHVIVFMFAMSKGGMALTEIIDHLAKSEDAYGAAAEEFDMIHRDVELFGNDLYTAIRNARNVTPSDRLEQFYDDVITVLESGGNLTRFLEEQGDRYLREAQEEQQRFLQTVAMMSEVFIVLFVATPLFLVVILLVISVLGGDQIVQLFVLIYAVLPLGMAGFLVILSTLGEPYKYPETELVAPEERLETEAPEVLKGSDEYGEYQKRQRSIWVRELLGNPLEAVRRNPEYTLALTVPAAVVLVVAQFLSGSAATTYEAFTARAISQTISLFLVPFLVVAAPLSFFHELKRGEEKEVARRFPDTLNILSSANNMGLGLTEGIDIVSRWTGGYFSRELRNLRNDIRWSSDLRGSLITFANRLAVPQVSLTLKIIAEGARSSGDLSHVLSIAAEDTRNRYRIMVERTQEMSMYIAVVFIGFLVYLLVIVMLDAYYLTPLAEIGAEQAAAGRGSGGPVGLADLPVDTYRMLFFHSGLVQGIGSGLLSGELAEGDVRGGLKYAILLSVIATFAFLLI